MINVYSFQKMIHLEDSPEEKNISKTSHFVFGQHYKKIIASTKASFDFRKFLQKHSTTRKKFAALPTHNSSKRNPLQEVSSSDISNQQTNLQTKAFKIRCYSRKLTKQNEKEDEIYTSKIIRYKPKVYPAKQQKQSEKKAIKWQSKKCLRMHKFDNFQQLQSISNNIKVVYSEFVHEFDIKTDKALVLDMNYLTNCMKAISSKSSEKDRETSHYLKKVIFFLKRMIQEKYGSLFPMERNLVQMPQIIFKVRKQQQISELLKNLQQCEFGIYYCIFSIQHRFVENIGMYNLTRINNLAQNIAIVDSLQNLSSQFPLVDSRHYIALSTFLQKSSFGAAFEQLFHQIENLEIRFTADQFNGQDPKNGHILKIPQKQLMEKVRQKKNLKGCRKISREKKQRCHSSQQKNEPQRKAEQKTLQNFKQKMLKYLKIVGTQNNLQSKKSRQILTSNLQDIQCMTVRQKCSKTNSQLVSQLIKINSHVQKQVSSYRRKMEEVQFHAKEEEMDSSEFIRFQKVYINTLY